MAWNRVTACKALLAYMKPDGEKVDRLELLVGQDTEVDAALGYLESVDMKPWGRGIAIRTDMFGNAVGGLNENTIQPWMQEKVFVLVQDVALLHDIVDEAIAAGACVVDIESQGLDTRVYDGEVVHHIVGFALCFDGEIGCYVPVRHVSANTNPASPENGNAPWDLVKPEIQRLLDNCRCVFHNAPFDQEIMHAEGFRIREDPESFDDTQLMGWLIDSNRKRIGLKAMSEDELGWKMINFKDLFPQGEKALHLEFLHPEECYVYASSDGICTWNLWNKYRVNEILAQQKLIHKVEKLLVPVLRRMQRNMVNIDVDYLLELDKGLEVKCEEYVAEIHKLCGDAEFSIDSAKQLGEVLFDKLGIPNAGKTPSGNQWKTDRQTLEDLDKKLNGKYPALTMVVKYRQMQKLRSTYISNLTENLDEFHQGRFGIQACGAPTGRFAAPGGQADQGYTGVNAQAIPKVKKDKPNIRKAFIARPGFIIAAIDFAGVELRIAGNLAREKKWITEFNHLDCKRKYDADYEVVGWSPLWQHCPYCRKKMGDVHSQTAVAVFGSAEETYRNKSKGVNFGILYGAGGKTIAENVGVSKDEGYRIVKSFKESLPGIAAWIKRQHRIAHKEKMVKTAFGRVRLLPEVDSDNKMQVAFGERSSVNSPVQGTSADITKIAMVACDKLIRKRGWEKDCLILLTVHDEIVFAVRDSMKDEILPALGLAMCQCEAKGWQIPLTVDIEWGRSWGEVTNAWKPPAPYLVPRRPDVPPLWEDEADAPARASRPAPETPTPTVTEPKPEPEQASTDTATEQPEKAPEAVDAPVPPPSTPSSPPVPQAATQQPESGVMEWIVKPPYTRRKWRKYEALFILAGDGDTRLVLKAESGQDLTGRRRIMVDPVYFRYKAEEWGL